MIEEKFVENIWLRMEIFSANLFSSNDLLSFNDNIPGTNI